MKLTSEQLRRSYAPLLLPTFDEKNRRPVKAIIGQERAIKALKFGLGNKGHGINIFVAGAPGTGKQTAIRHFLKTLAQQETPPGDWCYVNNFTDPYQPRKLSLPKGHARVFKNTIYQLVNNARAAL